MKKLLIFALCLVLLCPLAGCAERGDETENNASALDENGNLLLHDFESWDELNCLTGGEYFGKYVLNDDPAYVRTGAKSLALTPTGYGLATSADPYLVVQPSKVNEAYKDFSSVKKVQFDIFNANEENKEIEVSFFYGTATAALETPRLKYTLAAGLYSLQATEMSGSWPVFAAASIVVSLPVLIIFFLCQRHMVSGLTAGGVKG